MSRRTTHALGIFILTIISYPAFAQRERETWTTSPATLEVSGMVRVADLGEPARDVPVRLERFSGGLVEQMSTDRSGKFRFTGLPRGYYTVVVVAPGFNPAQQTADLQVVFRQYLHFELTRGHAISTEALSRAMAVIDVRVPEAARKEYAKARTALLDKNTKGAIQHLEKALFIYPEFFEAHLMLGTSCMDSRLWEKAENALTRALEIKPDNAPAQLSLGEVYWRQKRFSDAEKTLLSGLKLEDKSWHGYFTLGRLYWEMADIAKAGPALARTLQLKPDFAEAHLLAGNILLRVGQQERALAEYREYMRLAPKGEFVSQTRELVQKLSKAVADNKR